MLKFLIFLVLLVGSSLFVTDAFSLEIEFQTKSDWFIENMKWLTPGKLSLQEQLQIVIDESGQKNRISIGILSTNPNDIIFTDKIEALSSNPMINSFTLTNQFACAPTQIDRACVIIEVKREGLGDNINEISKNAREIADKIVGDGIMFFIPEFYSVTLQPKTIFGGSEEVFVAKVLYTINKQPTKLMFGAFAPMLLSSNVRDGGGFYNNAEKLSENYFSEISVTFMKLENNTLRSFHILLTCSNELRELPSCDPEGNIDEQIARGNINPLDFIQVENINRSKIFADQFYL